MIFNVGFFIRILKDNYFLKKNWENVGHITFTKVNSKKSYLNLFKQAMHVQEMHAIKKIYKI